MIDESAFVELSTRIRNLKMDSVQPLQKKKRGSIAHYMLNSSAQKRLESAAMAAKATTSNPAVVAYKNDQRERETLNGVEPMSFQNIVCLLKDGTTSLKETKEVLSWVSNEFFQNHVVCAPFENEMDEDGYPFAWNDYVVEGHKHFGLSGEWVDRVIPLIVRKSGPHPDVFEPHSKSMAGSYNQVLVVRRDAKHPDWPAQLGADVVAIDDRFALPDADKVVRITLTTHWSPEDRSLRNSSRVQNDLEIAQMLRAAIRGYSLPVYAALRWPLSLAVSTADTPFKWGSLTVMKRASHTLYQYVSEIAKIPDRVQRHKRNLLLTNKIIECIAKMSADNCTNFDLKPANILVDADSPWVQNHRVYVIDLDCRFFRCGVQTCAALFVNLLLLVVHFRAFWGHQRDFVDFFLKTGEVERLLIVLWDRLQSKPLPTTKWLLECQIALSYEKLRTFPREVASGGSPRDCQYVLSKMAYEYLISEFESRDKGPQSVPNQVAAISSFYSTSTHTRLVPVLMHFALFPGNLSGPRDELVAR